MSGIILCRSKYGASAKYAEWLSQETGFKITDTKKADIKEVAKYDTIVLGGGVYASSIAGIAFLKKNISALKGKNIYVYCCGMAPLSEEVLGILKNKNLSGELSDIPLFYYQGKWDMNDLNLSDKAMMKLYIKMLEKKDPSELKEYDRPMLEVKDKTMDWTDKKYLAPLIELIRSKGE
ncbi:MAG: flavodoxin domain-containing protein [Ruminococcus sp.]|uniref:flavodoxin domain-containing protein n=1 Tax=Ruminococcus sp. TaxID=41978 RepID=UPI0025FEB535|nr:flavodoxin domain-containing protein [Ruminococcus sp.]MCR5599901.1 flavodoxin domain-containing protein [Ruminococcus sp.]